LIWKNTKIDLNFNTFLKYRFNPKISCVLHWISFSVDLIVIFSGVYKSYLSSQSKKNWSSKPAPTQIRTTTPTPQSWCNICFCFYLKNLVIQSKINYRCKENKNNNSFFFKLKYPQDYKTLIFGRSLSFDA
jgi:hypothetical protein